MNETDACKSSEKDVGIIDDCVFACPLLTPEEYNGQQDVWAAYSLKDMSVLQVATSW